MDGKTGVARLRAAIKNQRDAGEGEFRLSFADVEAICKECEDELSRLSFAQGVPAPVDADGEVVPLTTRVMYTDDGRSLEVRLFRFNLDPNATRWVATCSNYNGSWYADVSNLHLHRPDSWERLEEDVGRCKNEDSYCAYYDKRGSSCVWCPAKNVKYCGSTVPVDVLRRAKALAERDAKEASCG